MYLNILGSFVLILTSFYKLVYVESNPQVPRDPSSPINSINWLIKMKQKNQPYEKFGFTYSKITACGLRYLQKRGVCKIFFSSEGNEFEMLPIKDDYPNLSCKSVRIDVRDIEVIDKNPIYLYMFECPNPYKMEPVHYRELEGSQQKSQQLGEPTQQGQELQKQLEQPQDQEQEKLTEQEEPKLTVRKEKEPFYMPLDILITGGVYPQSIVVGYRHASILRRPVKFHTVLLNIPVNKLNEINQQQRRAKSRKMPSRKFTKKKIKRLEVTVGPVCRSAQRAEDHMSTSEIIKQMHPYNKFKTNYDKVNICSLPKEDKLELCRQVFENDAYRLSISEIEDAKELVCRRQKVSIIYSASHFESVQAAVIMCPTEDTTNSYFLAPVHFLWNLVALIQISPFKEILPDAVLSRVNTEILKSLPALLRKKLKLIVDESNEAARLAARQAGIVDHRRRMRQAIPSTTTKPKS